MTISFDVLRGEFALEMRYVQQWHDYQNFYPFVLFFKCLESFSTSQRLVEDKTLKGKYYIIIILLFLPLTIYYPFERNVLALKSQQLHFFCVG